MRNKEMRDPEITRIKDNFVIGPKRGLKSHKLKRLWAKIQFWKLGINSQTWRDLFANKET